MKDPEDEVPSSSWLRGVSELKRSELADTEAEDPSSSRRRRGVDNCSVWGFDGLKITDFVLGSKC